MVINGYHGRNEILAKLIDGIKAMLTDFNLAGTWQVASLNQPTIQGLQNNTVYVDIIARRRYGTQGTKPVKVNGVWNDCSVWYEELLVQVGAFKQRDPNIDTELTLTSSDVIEYLQGCVNGNNDLGSGSRGSDVFGLDKRSYFGEDWLEVIRSTEMRELDYETDSGLKEKFPQFDFTLVVGQKLLKTSVNFANIEIGTERI